jgi:branched-subunit amino acid transport protein
MHERLLSTTVNIPPKMGHPATIDVEGVSDTKAIVIPNLLTVNGLSTHRAKAPKLVAGVAAWTSSDMFKTLVCCDIRILIRTMD